MWEVILGVRGGEGKMRKGEKSTDGYVIGWLRGKWELSTPGSPRHLQKASQACLPGERQLQHLPTGSIPAGGRLSLGLNLCTGSALPTSVDPAGPAVWEGALGEEPQRRGGTLSALLGTSQCSCGRKQSGPGVRVPAPEPLLQNPWRKDPCSSHFGAPGRCLANVE